MSIELKTYGSDRRMEIGGAECVRKMFCADDWTHIRIGLQLAFDDNANTLYGGPLLCIGVCSGASAMVSLAPTHVVGGRPDGTIWLRSTPSVISPGNTSTAFKRVGTTTTEVAFPTTNERLTGISTIRSGFFLDIEKGSPNYSLRRALPSADIDAQTDLTDANFLAAMGSDSTMSDITALAGMTMAQRQITTLPVNEGTDGPLDHLFVFWDRTTHKMSFNIRYRKLA